MGDTILAQKQILSTAIEMYKRNNKDSKVLNTYDNLLKLNSDEVDILFEKLSKEHYGLLCYCSGLAVNDFFSKESRDMCNAGCVGINYIYETLELDDEE